MAGRPNVTIKLPKKTKVGPNTRFYIDYSWWEESNLNLETYLSSRLGHDISLTDDGTQVDLIDAQTGEVRQLSGFEFAVQTYFSQQPADFAQRASLVDGAFSVLLANGNRPLTATEIAEQIRHSVDKVYKTLGSGKVFQGIRVYRDE